MNLKPAALVFADAAGKMTGQVMPAVDALERGRAIMKGLASAPADAVTCMVLTGRGIEKRFDVVPTEKPVPVKAGPRK
jgi:hypothetical protein